jgi:hypothetical protein
LDDEKGMPEIREGISVVSFDMLLQGDMNGNGTFLGVLLRVR